MWPRNLSNDFSWLQIKPDLVPALGTSFATPLISGLVALDREQMEYMGCAVESAEFMRILVGDSTTLSFDPSEKPPSINVVCPTPDP